MPCDHCGDKPAKLIGCFFCRPCFIGWHIEDAHQDWDPGRFWDEFEGG